jgi:hypothetical protein
MKMESLSPIEEILNADSNAELMILNYKFEEDGNALNKI